MRMRENDMERVTYLAKKHRELDEQISELEQIMPEARTEEQKLQISRLKKKKLKLKDEMLSLDSKIT